MQLYNDLIQVFNSDFFHLETTGGTFNIKEDEQGASVKQVSLDFHGQLMEIKKEVFNKTDFLFKDEKNTNQDMPVLRHGCDAILAIETRDKKYLVFIELKSDYTPDNIRKAEKQLCASYFRIMMLLACLKNVNLNQYKKCGIIVSHPLSTEKIAFIQKQKNTNSNKLNRYGKQSLIYAARGYQNFPLSRRYARLYCLPVKESFCFEELPTFHLSVPKDNCIGQFNLESILRQL